MSLYPKKLSASGEESKKSALKGFATQHTIKSPKNQTLTPRHFWWLLNKKLWKNLNHRQRSEFFREQEWNTLFGVVHK